MFHSANQNAGAGLAVAFRSQGYDYKGVFKGANTYELPQYDLIYGGGKDQKQGASYREALKEIYKNDSNFKTWLFQKGLDEIPQEYKFDNQAEQSK